MSMSGISRGNYTQQESWVLGSGEGHHDARSSKQGASLLIFLYLSSTVGYRHYVRGPQSCVQLINVAIKEADLFIIKHLHNISISAVIMFVFYCQCTTPTFYKITFNLD